jgi:salicylate synthase
MTILRYVSAVVPVVSDPCHIMTRLAQTARSDTYVVYEKPPVWTFAAGSIADVIVTCSRTTFRDHRGEQVVDRDPQQLAEVPRLLAQIDLPDWRAYGIATFELSYDNGERKEADGDAVLLRLAVPEIEVRIADGRAVVRGIRQDEVTALAEFVSQPQDQPRYQATPVDLEVDQGAGYRRTVQDAVRRIRAGKLQKVVLSRTVPLDAGVDLFGTFVLGRMRNTPARSFLISLDGLRAAGFSPEMVVEVSADGRVLTQPLAGTRALVPDDAGHSERLRADLLGDAKEVFEHMISVRAAYDDLVMVCRPESVAITEFMTVKPRGTVQHLGSRVIGELSDGHGPWDAFAAVFPAVTVTGTPKPAACECIQEYEESPRGLYGGAVLAVDSDGGMDAALVLRALFQQHDQTWLRAGAGIVAQSDPNREFEETCEKLRSVALNVVTKDNGGAQTLDRHRLRDDIAALLQCAPHEIDEQQNLTEQGLDSVAVMTLASKWQFEGITVGLTELIEQPTLNAWWDLLVRQRVDAQSAVRPGLRADSGTTR